MFCGECGTENKDTNSFCSNCGKGLKRPQEAAAPAPQVPVQPTPSSFHIPPVGASMPGTITPPMHAQTPQVPGTRVVQPSGAAAVQPGRNWLAILSFIVSLVSWMIFPILIGFIAAALGIFSLYRAKKDQSKIPVTAVLAIIIGLLAIVINFFWLEIFPPPEVLPPIK